VKKANEYKKRAKSNQIPREIISFQTQDTFHTQVKSKQTLQVRGKERDTLNKELQTTSKEMPDREREIKEEAGNSHEYVSPPVRPLTESQENSPES